MSRSRDAAPLPHGLRVIEFGAVLDVVAGYAGTDAGAAHVRGLRPTGDTEMARARLDITDEMISLVMRHDWGPPPAPDVDGALRRLTVAGASLCEEQLVAVGRLMQFSRRARGELRRDPDGLPRLHRLAESLIAEARIEGRVLEVFGAAGELVDGASPTLRRLRRDLRGSRSAMVRRLETFMRSLPERVQVPAASVTVRSGRYCIPIRREGASRVGGIVHDESATHQTLFVEPPSAIEEMNRIAGMEREERREIERILAELSDLLRPLAPGLVAARDALAEADSLSARARYALAHGGKKPRLEAAGDGTGLDIVEGVHPLLLAGGEPAVPFSLRLEPDERMLLVSGPNAGGKTVTLKAIGLTAALAQSGIVPPVGPESRLPVFDRFYAVIGDEQSIAASLSTFSAQVAGLGEILSEAGPHSLVLLDEVGSGTDPAEGAALAAAVLLRLAGSVRLTIATTHLGALKNLAAETPAVVNASLQFDAQALRPSFALVRDRPGRSYALEIATRLGLPDEVVRTARGRLSDSERRMEEVLAELESTEAELRRLTSGARADARDAHRRDSALAEREEKLARREAESEREGRAAAERYLLAARADVEAVIEELRADAQRSATASRSEDRAGAGAGGSATAAEGAARSLVEERLRETREASARVPSGHSPEDSGGMAPPEVGDRVRSRSLGVTGDVAEVRPGSVVVESRGMRFSLVAADLEPATGPAPASRPIPRADPTPPDLDARPEVDLRGLRVDEIERPLLAALDAAIVADLGRLVVIHGKGTGALKEEVSRLVESDARIATIRPGGFDEGGWGVTVLEFKAAKI
ncbi:MAG: endonuclease MutS2 [Gemmatimonadota bacterium]